VIEDDVIREVRAARDAFAAAHGYDIRAMVAALHEYAVASGREVVTFPPRPVVPIEPVRTPQPLAAPMGGPLKS
jgi:hypothetical protein